MPSIQITIPKFTPPDVPFLLLREAAWTTAYVSLLCPILSLDSLEYTERLLVAVRIDGVDGCSFEWLEGEEVRRGMVVVLVQRLQNTSREGGKQLLPIHSSGSPFFDAASRPSTPTPKTNQSKHTNFLPFPFPLEVA